MRRPTRWVGRRPGSTHPPPAAGSIRCCDPVQADEHGIRGPGAVHARTRCAPNVSLLAEAVIFLGAAVVTVPIFKRLGFGAVLGYLTAGIVIGPAGLRLVRDVDNILHFGEFGVVLLLFVIGLELQPSRLWVMRRSVFGLGSAQVLISAVLLGAAAYLWGLGLTAAVLVGLGLSLSSTAFALQMLAEKKQLTTRHGRTGFSILLFQDLAVIPLLALIPLLGGGVEADAVDRTTLLAFAKGLGAIVFVVVGGRYVIRHVFRFVAATGIHEVFTALALLTVIGTAVLMEWVGLSMALGAFLAGVLLADSEYRHALEADLEPFKGLLLGLFFIAVGMSVNLTLIRSDPVTVLGLVGGLLALKFVVLFAIGRFSGMNSRSASSLAATLPQGGEFAFVIFGVAVMTGVLGRGLVELLIVVVTLSMVVTPFLFNAVESLQKRLAPEPAKDYEQPLEEDNKVIIAGFGRFGQIIARILRAKRIGFTALEASPEQVDFVRRHGNKIYYGDASRLDLLRAAHAHQASLFILAIDDVEASLRTARTVIDNFPRLKILARARNRKHAYQLMDLGITHIWRETLLSSLDMAHTTLMNLGLNKAEATRAVETFKRHDEERLVAHHDMHNDEDRMVYLAKQAARELEELFEEDERENRRESNPAHTQ